MLLVCPVVDRGFDENFDWRAVEERLHMIQLVYRGQLIQSRGGKRMTESKFCDGEFASRQIPYYF
jgi:hypothetical protein